MSDNNKTSIIKAPSGMELGPFSFSEADKDAIAEVLAHAHSENTRRAYASDWKDWEKWCHARHVASLPVTPESLAAFLTSRAAYSAPTTIQRKAVTIAKTHRLLKQPGNPLTEEVWMVIRGIRRRWQGGTRAKQALTVEHLKAMLACLEPPSDKHHRERAMLLVGFGGAFRRSELVSILRGDVEWTSTGVLLTLRKSKTDQEGIGRRVAIAKVADPSLDPVSALEHWLAITPEVPPEAPIFPFHPQEVSRLLKRLAECAGIDPALVGGHSLRAGHVTAALAAGAREIDVMSTTGHRSVTMLARYKRDVKPEAANSSSAFAFGEKQND